MKNSLNRNREISQDSISSRSIREICQSSVEEMERMSVRGTPSRLCFLDDDSESQPPCVLCERNISNTKMPGIIQKALSRRYAVGLEFYYLKGINNIIKKKRSGDYIAFKDVTEYNKEEEFLRRLYQHDEFEGKFQFLWKFHQFTKTRPSIVNKSTYPLIVKNYHYKRRLHEKAIRRMLEKLSDSELENGEINIEEFMNEHEEFLEERPSEISNQILYKSQLESFSTVSLKNALRNSVQGHCDNILFQEENQRDNNIRSSSSRLLQESWSEICNFATAEKKILEKGYIQSMGRPRQDHKMLLGEMDISKHFKQSVSWVDITVIDQRKGSKDDQLIYIDSDSKIRTFKKKTAKGYTNSNKYYHLNSQNRQPNSKRIESWSQVDSNDVIKEMMTHKFQDHFNQKKKNSKLSGVSTREEEQTLKFSKEALYTLGGKVIHQNYGSSDYGQTGGIRKGGSMKTQDIELLLGKIDKEKLQNAKKDKKNKYRHRTNPKERLQKQASSHSKEHSSALSKKKSRKNLISGTRDGSKKRYKTCRGDLGGSLSKSKERQLLSYRDNNILKQAKNSHKRKSERKKRIDEKTLNTSLILKHKKSKTIGENLAGRSIKRLVKTSHKYFVSKKFTKVKHRGGHNSLGSKNTSKEKIRKLKSGNSANIKKLSLSTKVRKLNFGGISKSNLKSSQTKSGLLNLLKTKKSQKLGLGPISKNKDLLVSVKNKKYSFNHQQYPSLGTGTPLALKSNGKIHFKTKGSVDTLNILQLLQNCRNSTSKPSNVKVSTLPVQGVQPLNKNMTAALITHLSRNRSLAPEDPDYEALSEQIAPKNKMMNSHKFQNLIYGSKQQIASRSGLKSRYSSARRSRKSKRTGTHPTKTIRPKKTKSSNQSSSDKLKKSTSRLLVKKESNQGLKKAKKSSQNKQWTLSSGSLDKQSHLANKKINSRVIEV